MVVLGFALTGCGQDSQSALSTLPGAEDQQGDIPSEYIEPHLDFCSKLSFDGMRVPRDLSYSELNTFALALNISSSFEGREFWKNITNNFDGQGLSLGLLNQTLGTGSLQPLLLEMLQVNPVSMKASFSETNFKSIEKMILDWKKAQGLQLNLKSEDLFAQEGESLSNLDSVEDSIVKIMGNSEDASVRWAVKTIYTSTSGKTFKPDWKKQLQGLCVTAEYRAIQFEAARFIHEKAKAYMARFALTELRSYLFLFDIVVQNGGFYQKNLDDFKAFMKKNPAATEEQKLKALLESRLVQVKDEYKANVKARKESLIKGSGLVHGDQRNYEREYCYTSGRII